MRRPYPLLIGTIGALALLQARRRRERRLTERIAAAALEALLNAIDANDRQTGAHVRRVARYSLVLARAAGLDTHARRALERIALFHDIGKIHAALFDIVHGRDRLSPRERALVASHPQRGADVLRPLATFYPDLAAGVLAHHERWDGRGYPRGLRGLQIPLTSRIVAIADTFDVITHGRHYEQQQSVDDARRAITRGRGTQFDPRLVDLALSPDVYRALLAARCLSYSPRIVRGERRHRVAEEEPAPDITFRWRSESLARLPRGRSPRARRGSPPPPAPPPR